MNKNILDEYWKNWDKMQWSDKYDMMRNVALCLMQGAPSSDDLVNLRIKLKNLRDTEDKCLITPSEQFIKKRHQELIKQYGEDYDPWRPLKIEMPSKEAKDCCQQLYQGEITIKEYAEKMKKVPRGTVPAVLDDFWVDWELKSLEEKVHLIMAALGGPRKGVCSGIDILNLGAYSFDVEEKLGCKLPEF